ncbi:OmpH family outer membrane protein [bacterium]|nr:MAG: OmpH family outer membrane protein [bacterium]
MKKPPAWRGDSVKRIVSSIVPALVATVAFAAPAQADIKVGVVNYGRLMQDSPQAKTALDAIRGEFAGREKELQTSQVQLKSKEDRMQKDAATMSETQRSSSEKELRDGYRELARKQQEFQDDLNARRNEDMSRLQKALVEEVQVYAKAQNFDLVLADGVIYFNNSMDITPAILTALQARKGTAAPAKPAAK